MKVTYDKEADAMYIYLEKIKPSGAKGTVRLNDDILVDLDAKNKMIGIEILDVSKNVDVKSFLN